MTLQEFVNQLMTPAFVGIAVYAILERVEWFATLSPVAKRYASLVLSVVLPWAAFGAQVYFGWAQVSADGLFQVAAVCWLASQIIHAEAKMR